MIRLTGSGRIDPLFIVAAFEKGADGVLIAGCEEGLIPWEPPGEMATDPAEERRLFYVGLTRAQSRVILTASGTRAWAGPPPRRLSRFIAEIPAHLLSAAAPAPLRKSKARKGSEQMELF